MLSFISGALYAIRRYAGIDEIDEIDEKIFNLRQSSMAAFSLQAASESVSINWLNMHKTVPIVEASTE